MKKFFLVLALSGSIYYQLFSQTIDSTFNNKMIIDTMAQPANEFGISLDNIKMNDFLSSIFNNVSLHYKHKFKTVSVRAEYFTYYYNSFSYCYGIPDTNKDPTVEYHVKQEFKSYGAAVGIEKDVALSGNTTFFYGMDVALSHVNYRSETSDIYFSPETKIPQTYGLVFIKNGPKNFILNGYTMSFNPLVGITQNIGTHFSATVEMNLMFHYTDYQQYLTRLESDLKTRLIINYRI